MAKRKADLEALLRISYEYGTPDFLIMCGYPEEDAKELLKRYTKYRQRTDKLGEAFAEAAEAFNKLNAVEIK